MPGVTKDLIGLSGFPRRGLSRFDRVLNVGPGSLRAREMPRHRTACLTDE